MTANFPSYFRTFPLYFRTFRQIYVLRWTRIKKVNWQNVSKIQFYCQILLRQTHYVHFAYFKKYHRALIQVVDNTQVYKHTWVDEHTQEDKHKQLNEHTQVDTHTCVSGKT